MDTHPSLDYIDPDTLERILDVLKQKDVRRFKAGGFEIEFSPQPVLVQMPGVFKDGQKAEPAEGTPSGYAAVFGGSPPPRFKSNSGA